MKKILIFIIGILLAVEIFAAPGVGDKAVDFTLPSLYNENKTLSSKELQGKVVLLNLWASWCSGCQEEMPLFVKLQQEFNKQDFEIVLSSIDSSAQNGIDFLQQVDPQQTLTSLYDAKKTLPKAYRCAGMPSSYLIDQEGNIVAVYIGSLDEEAMQKLHSKIVELIGK